jgi:hypothetical protein
VGDNYVILDSRAIALDVICCAIVVMAGCSAQEAAKPGSTSPPLKPTRENASRLKPGQRVVVMEESADMGKSAIFRVDGAKWGDDFLAHGSSAWPAIMAGVDVEVVSDKGTIEDPWRMVTAKAHARIRFDLHDGQGETDDEVDHTFWIERKNLREKP